MEATIQARIFARVLNSLNEPVCWAYTSPRYATVTLVDDVSVIPDAHFPDGVQRDIYVIAVTWQHRTAGVQTGFILTTWEVADAEPEGTAL